MPGRGLLLIEAYMDKVQFTRGAAKNEDDEEERLITLWILDCGFWLISNPKSESNPISMIPFAPIPACAPRPG
jgi:hypothetical protein